jgi:hypothetical protein
LPSIAKDHLWIRIYKLTPRIHSQITICNNYILKYFNFRPIYLYVLAQNLQSRLAAPQYNTQNNIYQHGKQVIAARQDGLLMKKGGIRIKNTFAKRLGPSVAIFSPATTVSIPD